MFWTLQLSAFTPQPRNEREEEEEGGGGGVTPYVLPSGDAGILGAMAAQWGC